MMQNRNELRRFLSLCLAVGPALRIGPARGCLLGVLAWLSFPAHAHDAVEAVLYGPTLKPEPIVLLELDGDRERIVYLDEAGTRHEAGFDQAVRLTFPVQTVADAESMPALATTDGQRIVGRSGEAYVRATGDQDSLRWRGVDGMRPIEVSLDDLAWVVYQPEYAPRPAAPPVDDVLLLPNGEQLTGFVETLGAISLGFVIGDAPAAVQIDTPRIAGLYMSNTRVTDVPPGVWVTMRSGSRWRGELGQLEGRVAFYSPLMMPVAEESEGGEQSEGAGGAPAWNPLRLGSADRPEEDWAVVSRIDLPSAGRRLVPLSSLPMSVVSGGEVFGVPTPPRQSASGALSLHAPVAVAFDLPAGARRIVMTVALEIGDDIPEDRYAWAGCEVVIHQGGAELARFEIDAEHPQHSINLPLDADAAEGDVVVMIEEGVNGPVLDRIKLRDAEVLIGDEG